MRKKVFLFSNLIVFTAIAFALTLFNWKTVWAEDSSFRLMVFGDSLSAGYGLPEGSGFVPQLEMALNNSGLDNVVVLNAAVSGNTTVDGVNRLNAALAQKPHAVIVELGANDVLQGANMDNVQKNLETIITTFQDNDIPVMLVGIRIPMVADVKGRERLNEIYQELAKKYKLILYPNFFDGVVIERFGVYDLKYLQSDGAHPNAAGVQVMVKKILPTVTKFLTSL